jgi:hypothetical protein
MKRPRTHVQEDRSEAVFRDHLPDEWIVRRKPKDYGIDFELEIVRDEMVTGDVLWVQLKSTSRYLKPDSDVHFQCSTNFLRYCRGCEVPILLVLIDLHSNDGYWIHVQDHLRRHVGADDQRWSQASANVTIRSTSTLTVQRQRRCADFVNIASGPRSRRMLLEVYAKVLALKETWAAVTPFLDEPYDDE